MLISEEASEARVDGGREGGSNRKGDQRINWRNMWSDEPCGTALILRIESFGQRVR